MSRPVIKVENLGKAYQLGQFSTGTLKSDVLRWWAIKRGKEDPFLKIGETNDRTTRGGSNVVWSLRDINFEIEQGDAVGIIGKNGAGKSTLLKILSQITNPTTGRAFVKGRVASLLEVGTGFHPELTGRENIFLNGAILGMTKKEIARKFDEIVDFSGVERYVDSPVKRYSSGMYVRLAFAVAAHLESEILIVDEVLAVGDAEFQRKCMGKMGDISKGEGRTILFVSHSMSSMRQLCKKGLLLVNGTSAYSGSMEDTIEFYLESGQSKNITNQYQKEISANKDVELISAITLNSKHVAAADFDVSEEVVVKLDLWCKSMIPGLYGYVAVKNKLDEFIIESDTHDIKPNCLEDLVVGKNTFFISIKPNLLAVGEYKFYVSFSSQFAENYLVDVPGDILKFNIVDNTTQRGNLRTSKTSFLLNWKNENAIK